jgi:hypothetical protein
MTTCSENCRSGNWRPRTHRAGPRMRRARRPCGLKLWSRPTCPRMIWLRTTWPLPASPSTLSAFLWRSNCWSCSGAPTSLFPQATSSFRQRSDRTGWRVRDADAGGLGRGESMDRRSRVRKTEMHPVRSKSRCGSRHGPRFAGPRASPSSPSAREQQRSRGLGCPRKMKSRGLGRPRAMKICRVSAVSTRRP